MKRYLNLLSGFMASRLFFRLTVAGLIIAASWLALTGQYPMAFDEEFHLGLIRIYASHGLPFIAAQPPNADSFGAVARDPSFLYHYLMSFAYQFIHLFTNQESVQVLFLRAINIALLTSSLPLFHKLLRRAGASRLMANGCIALFTLIPITPLLAAQINYDNLLLPITALTLLLCLRIVGSHGVERLRLLLQIMALGLMGSLVKFAFLPIFIGIIGWLLVLLRAQIKPPETWIEPFRQFVRPVTGKLLIIALILLSIMAVNRYGVNLIRYRDPIPDCGKVLALSHCQYYGPYIRDYNFNAAKPPVHLSPITFTKEWFYGMWLRSVFAVDGPKTQYETRGPFIIPAFTVIILLVVGTIALLIRGWRGWRQPPYAKTLFVTIIAAYTAALWLQEFKAYAHTAMPVAINGRYLLPIILPLLYLGAQALSDVLGRRQTVKIAFLVIGLLAMTWGGGALTYILRSNDSWYWNTAVVRTVNHAVQRVVGPVTPGNNQPQLYLR